VPRISTNLWKIVRIGVRFSREISIQISSGRQLAAPTRPVEAGNRSVISAHIINSGYPYSSARSAVCRYTVGLSAQNESRGVDSNALPNAALIEAARSHAARTLGRARLPCQVVVKFSDELDIVGVSVEVIGVAGSDDLPASECFRDIVALLARGGQRMTTTQILAGLTGQDTPHGEGPVKATLSAAVRDGLLTNRQQARPPGYGLPSWP
jgi:hypothetical protein